jgi:SAM-dependent methyltransferase
VLSIAIAQEEPFVAPYVPTVKEDVELMLDVADVQPDDYVIDLGSGDGRIVIAAARRGALGHGVELDPELASLARVNSQEAGVADRVAFEQGDIFEADIDRATVVTLYLFPEANLALRPKLLAELRPGTRVVSNSFHMDDWKPDVHDMSARSSGGILLWIIPARIDGDWTLEIDEQGSAAMTVRQTYQEIELEFMGLGATPTVDSAVLEGDRIRFAFRSEDAMYVFDGSVENDNMQGHVQIEREDGESIATFENRPGR